MISRGFFVFLNLAEIWIGEYCQTICVWPTLALRMIRLESLSIFDSDTTRLVLVMIRRSDNLFSKVALKGELSFKVIREVPMLIKNIMKFPTKVFSSVEVLLGICKINGSLHQASSYYLQPENQCYSISHCIELSHLTKYRKICYGFLIKRSQESNTNTTLRKWFANLLLGHSQHLLFINICISDEISNRKLQIS